MDKKLIYVGCGHHRMAGFTHVEVNIGKSKSGPPDILCDITDSIPLDDNLADLIYSRATLEHLTYRELVNHLLECFRILKKGGCVRMVVPDFDMMIKEYKKEIYWSDLEKNLDLPNENYTDTFIARMLYNDHYYLHNFDTLARVLEKTGFDGARECNPGDSKIESANEELLKAEACRFGEIIIETVKLDGSPKIKKFIFNYSNNPIKKILEKYFNIAIVPYKRRRPIFPSKSWFKEKVAVLKSRREAIHQTGSHGKKAVPPKYWDKLDLDIG